jgi:hypothetical protein
LVPDGHPGGRSAVRAVPDRHRPGVTGGGRRSTRTTLASMPLMLKLMMNCLVIGEDRYGDEEVG